MSFTPRKTSDGMQDSKWWYSSGNVYYPTYGLPNCTCYAYGRYAEIRGSFASLPSGNAGDWYSSCSSSFKKGSTPALGAVVCWSPSANTPNASSNVGHVAIVEEIYDNGDFLVSYSGWGGPYFSTIRITKSSGYSEGFDLNYHFDGFIYNTDTSQPSKPLPSASWHATSTGWGFTRDSNEAFENAIMMYKFFKSKGYTNNAIFAIIGNVGSEGLYNPWQWESCINDSYNGSHTSGYGLFGFTPASKYVDSSTAKSYEGFAPNFSDKAGNPNDGNAQLLFVHNNMRGFYDRWSYYGLSNPTNITTYEQFIQSELDVQTLSKVWCVMWEGPRADVANFEGRASNAQYWKDKFADYDGFTVEETQPIIKRKSMPLYMMIRRRF